MEVEMKFEEKMNTLENLVNELEQDDISLDESVEKYTKAMKLIQECDKELKVIDEKVAKIVAENGTVSDFELEN